MLVTLTSVVAAATGMVMLGWWHLAIAWAAWMLAERLIAASIPKSPNQPAVPATLPKAATLLLWLAIDLVLSCSLATAAGLLRLNFSATYVLLAAVTLLVASLPQPQAAVAALKRLGAMIRESLGSLPGWLVTVGGLIFGPLLLLNIRPVHDNDSLYAMTFVIDWMRNAASPYYGYPTGIAFWEMGYLPSVVMTRSTAFLWIHTLKAIWLLAMGAYSFARQSRMKHGMAAAISATCLLTYFYWAYFGVGTLKNDVAVAAGFVLLVVSGVHALRTSPGWWSAVAAAAGVALLSVKFSGPFIGVAMIAIWILAALGDGKKLLRLMMFAPVSIAIILLSSGHYYVANIVTHGAPFHPVKITILGWNLGGNSHFPDTAILDHWSNPELWRYFFLPPTIVSAAGVYFPLIMVLAIALGGLLVIATGYRLLARKPMERGLLFIGLAVLMGWALYFRSPWSAGSVTSPFRWLENMVSLRYALGVFTISEVLVVAAALRFRLPGWLVWLAIAGQSTSRLVVLAIYFANEESLGTYPLTLAIVVLAGWCWSGALLLASRSRLKFGSVARVVMVGMLVIFLASPGCYYLNRSRNNPTYRDAYTMMRDLPASQIGMIVLPEVDTGFPNPDGTTAKLPTWNRETGVLERFQFRYNYPVVGDRFQHETVWLREPELTVEAVGSLDYLVFLQPPWCYRDPARFAELAAKVESLGFDVMVRTGHELVAKRR